jgi:ubiquitin-protein ligase
MGDPLSATAAALGLPGIFISCVQCFELIQRGRNYERDLLILTTKFSNQQLRFSKWGEACGFGTDSGYDYRLDDPSLRPNVLRTLHSLKLILDDGLVLIQKYNPRSRHSTSSLDLQAQSGRWSWTLVRERIRRSRSENHSRGASRWALSDKKALDELVKHLHDLIGDLETMTAGLRIRERQRLLVQYEIESISEPSVLEVIEESRIDSIDLVSDAASSHLRSIMSLCSRPASRYAASLPSTERTVESYRTAAEYLSPLYPLVDSSDSSLPLRKAELRVRSHEPATAPNQNQRIMNDLLEQAYSCGSLSTFRLMDTSRVGQVLQSFRFDTLNDKFGDRLRALDLPSLSGYPAKRLRKELKQASMDFNPDHECWSRWSIPHRPTWLTIHSIADHLNLILGSLEGPPSTPYAGGLFHFIIYVRPGYPLRGPKFLAVTKIYHPNISSTGEICVDTVNEAWNPHYDPRFGLTSIASILDDPGLDDPLVPEVAETYLRDRSTYDKNARLYTQKYASPDYLFTDDGLERCFQMCLKAAREE